MEEIQEKIISFLTKNAKAVASFVLLIVLVGAGYGVFRTVKISREKSAQEAFGSVERNYNDLRQKYLQAEMEKNQPKPISKDKSAPPPALNQASGDLQKDYGQAVEGFERILKDYSSSQAAKISALYLSEIYSDYKKLPEAQSVLEKTLSNSKDLLSVLVGHRLATVIADQGKCSDARLQWQSLMEGAPSYLKNEMKLRVASCFEQEGQVDQAKSIYEELSHKNPQVESFISKDAEKYLRALNFKKSVLTGQTVQ